MATKYKIAVFIDSGMLYAPLLLRPTAAEPGLNISKVYIRRRSASRLQVIRSVIRKSGWWYATARIRSFFKLARIKKREIAAGLALEDRELFEAEELCRAYHLKYEFIENCNVPRVIEEIRQSGVDIILSVLYTQLFKDELLNAPRLVCINAHPSLLPEFRGTNPIYWAMVEQRRVAGITFHQIDVGVDTGAIIDQLSVPIEPDDTHHMLYSKVTRLGGRMLRDLLLKLQQGGSIKTRPQPEGNWKSYPAPTPQSYKDFRKLGRRFV